MNKNLFWLIALLFPLSFGFVSCAEDTAVEDPYANWQVRNEHYIDSIADVARANLGEEVGKWKIYRNYKIANESTTPGLGGTIVILQKCMYCLLQIYHDQSGNLHSSLHL